jgi:hypothetical protein
MKRQLSKLREEEKRDKELHQEAETIIEIGKEGREGVKNAKEFFASQEKAVEAEKDILKESLDGTNKKLEYNQILAGYLLKNLVEATEIGWNYKVAPTEKGVIMELNSPDGRKFRQAFASCGDIDVDLNATEVFVIRVVNTIDKWKNPIIKA